MEKKPAPHQPTALVFSDKHIQEVKNYAIVGQTLWIFDEQRAVKVPLSSLDVDATNGITAASTGMCRRIVHLPDRLRKEATWDKTWVVPS